MLLMRGVTFLVCLMLLSLVMIDKREEVAFHFCTDERFCAFLRRLSWVFSVAQFLNCLYCSLVLFSLDDRQPDNQRKQANKKQAKQAVAADARSVSHLQQQLTADSYVKRHRVLRSSLVKDRSRQGKPKLRRDTAEGRTLRY